VPAWPLSPFGTVAHVGPMSRSVADAALMLSVMSLPDARDWHALPYEPRDYRADLERGIRDLRIAYSSNLGYAEVDREVADIVHKAINTFVDLGARVEEKHPGFENAGPIFQTHWFSGAAALIRTVKDTKLVDPGLLEVAAQGAKITAAELMDAQMKRGALGMHMNLFHRDYDLLVTPTLAVAAFDVGQETPIKGRWTDWTPFTYPFNLTGQPAASIACGFTKAGLPVGLQIVGPRFADALVLRAARAFESVRPVKLPDLARLAP
jgi:aspartyl-tRNA(Asn)/glutamyl-tRNA(Gln) amidotransferase subunit A